MKWRGAISSPREVAGGGPQGGTAWGMLEYLSQTSNLLSFLPEEEAWRYVDDASFIEVINLAMVGLASYNAKQQVPSDMIVGEYFLPSENFKTQQYLNKISECTDKKEFSLNARSPNI